MDKKGRIYVCHTFYHVYVACLKEFYIAVLIFNCISEYYRENIAVIIIKIFLFFLSFSSHLQPL